MRKIQIHFKHKVLKMEIHDEALKLLQRQYHYREEATWTVQGHVFKVSEILGIVGFD